MKTDQKVAAVLALAAVLDATAAHAQLTGEAPATMITNAATTALGVGGAAAALAGMVHGVNVWMGTRDLWAAAKWLIGGASLFFGMAALVGFG